MMYTQSRAFKRRTVKHELNKAGDTREQIAAKIKEHVQAYINSGKQIQQCTPCTYVGTEKSTERQAALNKGER